MINSQDFKNLEERKSQLAFDVTQQKRNKNDNTINNNLQNVNTEERKSGIIRLKNFDEGEENIDLGKIININDYKNNLEEGRNSGLLDKEINLKEEREKEGINMLNVVMRDGDEELLEKSRKKTQQKVKEAAEEKEEDGQLKDNQLNKPKFKSMLSKGNDDKFEFSKYEKNDTKRMTAVTNALQDYYALMKEENIEHDDLDEEGENELKARYAQAKLNSLQTIVSACNRYIANRWPISKQGRERLKEVKILRKEAIKELGEHAGHPGWRLAGEYLKLGLKALVLPVAAPAIAAMAVPYYMGKGAYYAVKHTGIWAYRSAKRIGKATGKALRRKMSHTWSNLKASFSSWRAFGATLAAIGAALLGFTFGNAACAVCMAVEIVPWLVGSIFTLPRYWYHLARGHVKTDALSSHGDFGKYRSTPFTLIHPHRFWTWFKWFYFAGGTQRKIRGIHEGEDTERGGISYIYNKAGANLKTVGHHFQYSGTAKGAILGPVTDTFYHHHTRQFQRFCSLFKYSEKDNFENIAKRADEDYYGSFDGRESDISIGNNDENDEN